MIHVTIEESKDNEKHKTVKTVKGGRNYGPSQVR